MKTKLSNHTGSTRLGWMTKSRIHLLIRRCTKKLVTVKFKINPRDQNEDDRDQRRPPSLEIPVVELDCSSMMLEKHSVPRTAILTQANKRKIQHRRWFIDAGTGVAEAKFNHLNYEVFIQQTARAGFQRQSMTQERGQCKDTGKFGR